MFSLMVFLSDKDFIVEDDDDEDDNESVFFSIFCYSNLFIIFVS
jgi:hypothetical protein